MMFQSREKCSAYAEPINPRVNFGFEHVKTRKQIQIQQKLDKSAVKKQFVQNQTVGFDLKTTKFQKIIV